MTTRRPRKPKPLWVLVTVKPGRESYACENIARQGFEYYNPKFFCERRKDRMAMFPGYVFVNTPSGQHRWLENTYGCFGAVMFGDEVAKVPLDIIKRFKASENRNGLVTLPNGNFTAGEDVKMTGGLYVGHQGIFSHYSDQRRVCILLSMWGRQVPAVIPDVFVERVAKVAA